MKKSSVRNLKDALKGLVTVNISPFVSIGSDSDIKKINLENILLQLKNNRNNTASYQQLNNNQTLQASNPQQQLSLRNIYSEIKNLQTQVQFLMSQRIESSNERKASMFPMTFSRGK